MPMKRLGTDDFDSIKDEKIKITIGFGKTVIAKLASQYGWRSNHHGIYIYESGEPQKQKDHESQNMLSSVIEFSKQKGSRNNSWYPQDIVKIIKEMPQYFSTKDSTSNMQVKEHLNGVIAHREKIQNESCN